MSFHIDPEYFQKELEKLPGWKQEDGRIKRDYIFRAHLDAVQFVEAVSLEAIADDRFPDIFLSHARAILTLPGGEEKLSIKDLDLAAKIERFSKAYTEK
ncbi:MAG TPA: 4a-hydroxytetrahydrobiopterin dehydratase [Acidobacteriota bacterium]|nr:4a-hydroxytetrahydrobiopterin dehydratase [Acidobacteriota bacterium]HNT17061.1 4a-hydroxytetrahydrobiopterin dehydratase [Acidobacteriota bacterium]HPA26073.1 4a-hydroxytetrahydrobiopterin dehydratase [Acidobacteriota bacterium]HQO19294.1 4a-hydroxytetrahydrobiopterin dehydratase [Acidobacteriota bacterium]HQQ46106.1 4a-hydroxytetrahydrobiopterin dehydratase [Acidobacteriota bacterium]